jgi:hypothetical protein
LAGGASAVERRACGPADLVRPRPERAQSADEQSLRERTPVVERRSGRHGPPATGGAPAATDLLLLGVLLVVAGGLAVRSLRGD